MRYLILLCLLFTVTANAVPENELQLVWQEEILPYYRNMKQGSFTNSQNLEIRFNSLTDPSYEKSIVILPGRSEPAIKYAELIYDLRHSKVNIFIMDHQGQGESQRLLNNRDKGYVENFNDYVTDVEQFIEQFVLARSSSGPLYLLAHSMGGSIGTRYMYRHPKVFKKAILASPMFEVNTRPYPEAVAQTLSTFLVLSGNGKKYAPSRGPYLPEEDIFERNKVTTSEARFNITKFISTKWNELVVGGATNRWVSEALKATRKIDKLKLETKVLLLQAGDDQIVKLGRQNSFCKNNNCQKIHFPNAGHEILMEQDYIRDRALENIHSFFEF